MRKKPPTPSHAEREHAFLSCSAAERWLNCPAAPRLEYFATLRQLESRSAASDKGTATHELAQAMLLQRKRADDPAFASRTWGNAQYPTVVLAEHAQTYVDYVLNALDFEAMVGAEAPVLHVESRLDVIGKDCWGTADAVIHTLHGLRDEPHDHLIVMDLKTGSKPVEAAENPQLALYALGAWKQYADATPADRLRVTLVIAQVAATDPAERFKEWEAPPGWLVAFEKRAKAAAKAALDPRAEPTPGAHCQWCKAKATCPAQAALVAEAFTGEKQALAAPLDPGALTPPQVAFVLEHRKTLRDWIDAVEAKAYTAPPSGWKVVEGTSRSRWRGEKVDVATILTNRGFPARYEVVLPTIGEARKSGIDVEDLIEKPPGKPTLVPESDTRPAVTGGFDALPNDE